MSTPAPRRSRAPLASAGERIVGPVVGSITGFVRGQVLVTYPGNVGGPRVAQVLSSLDDEMLERAAKEQAKVVLLFEDGEPARPLLVGILRSATPLLEAILTEANPPEEMVARVDGRHVLIEGKEEVVLRCGKATLTLRRDGKVVLRGVNVVTQADEVHKVRGGKVQIN